MAGRNTCPWTDLSKNDIEGMREEISIKQEK